MRIGEKLSLFFLLFLCLNDVLHGKHERYEVKEVCSGYSFYGSTQSDNSWEFARNKCSGNLPGLVSLETNEEWESLKNFVNTPSQSFQNDRWYIGLKYSSHKWCWLSNTKVCLNDKMKRRWDKNEPNNLGTEQCVVMFKGGLYNNIPCNKNLGYIGYICETNIDCSNASRYRYFFNFQRTTVQSYTADAKHSTQKSTAQPYKPTSAIVPYNFLFGAKTSATTAEISTTTTEIPTTAEISTPPEISTTAKAIKQRSNYITSTKLNIYSPTGSGKQKTIMRSSTQDKALPVYHPNDDSNSENRSPSITIIVVAVLAVLLMIVLVVLGSVIWRRRSSSSKERNDQMDSNVIHGIRLESVSGQGPHEQTQPLQNETSLQEDKKEDVPHLYAVVEKRNKAAHRSSRMSTTQYPVPDDDEQICVTSNPPSEPSLERKDHIFANANQAEPKRKPPVCPKPYVAAQKRPTEHADNTNGKEQYLYAAVDKTRKRNKKDEPSVCGPVYAELGFNPSQDEGETEMRTQDSFTVYASIQEGQ